MMSFFNRTLDPASWLAVATASFVGLGLIGITLPLLFAN